MKSLGRALCAAWLAVVPAAAETVVVGAGRDATLVQDAEGALANGSGQVFFAGRTNQAEGSVRRSVLYFDVAGALPPHAIVESVSLTLHLTPSNPAPREVRLHRVLADWGEGPSASSGGSGAPAEPGDVTWVHTFYDNSYWIHAGGQFVGRASAALEVEASASYTWASNVHLVQDVKLWAAAPQKNFGWILVGDEAFPQTVKAFSSREAPEPALRPVLEIVYRLP